MNQHASRVTVIERATFMLPNNVSVKILVAYARKDGRLLWYRPGTWGRLSYENIKAVESQCRERVKK